MEWFRFYNDVRADNKIRHLSDAEFRVWVNLLCLASDQPDDARGTVPLDDPFVLAAEVANADEALLETTIAKLQALHIVAVEAAGLAFTQWDKRQFRSDSSTARVQKHRAQRASTSDAAAETPRNGGETFPEHRVTPTDPDPDPDSDPDTEHRARAREAVRLPADVGADPTALAGGDVSPPRPVPPPDPAPRPSVPDGFQEAERWVATRLGRLALRPQEWPVLTAQLAAVDGDVPTYRRLVDAVLAQHPGETVSSIKYFDHAVARWHVTHQLPPVSPRASPPGSAPMQDDATVADYRAMAAAQAAGGGINGGLGA